MTQFNKWNVYAEMAMSIVDEMMENPEAALNNGVVNLIDFVVLISTRGSGEGRAAITEERWERYKKLAGYLKKLEEPAARILNQRGTLHIFAVEYANEYLNEALEQEKAVLGKG